MFKENMKKCNPYKYLVFRVLVGLLFLGHGLMKFGLLGGSMATAYSLFWFAAIIETVVGLAIAFGFYVRPAALLGILEMLYAYFTVHLPNGMIPYANGGELALLYIASFLVIKVYGAGEYSLEKTITGEEKF